MSVLSTEAEGYLKSDPDPWIERGTRIVLGLRTWLADNVPDTPRQAVLRVATRRLITALLDPKLLRGVAGTRQDHVANELITARLHDALTSRPIEFAIRTRRPLDVLDRDELDDHRARMNAHEDSPDSFFSLEAVGRDIRVYQAVQVGIDQPTVLAAVRGVVELPNHTSSVLVPAIARLEIGDYSLYEALTRNPTLMRSLHWRTFERLLADVLDAHGYEIELQHGTKDGGIDIIAIRRTGPIGEHRYLLQAKRWSHRVGIEPVRQLLFLHGHHRVTKACLATTATFTAGAWQLAHQYRWQLELRDAEGIAHWIRGALSRRMPGSSA